MSAPERSNDEPRPSGARFVAIEGIEASGKSTLLTALAARLRAAGRDVVTTREPGGTPFGNRAREIFLDPALAIDPIAEVLLLNASRAQLVADVVRPALARGAWVLTDRFSLATLAYQGYGRGMDLGLLRSAIRVATGGLEPGDVVLVDVPVDVSRSRVRSRSLETGIGADRLEREDDGFHDRVRAGYLALAAADPRVRVVDGRLGPAELADAAFRIFADDLYRLDPGSSDGSSTAEDRSPAG